MSAVGGANGREGELPVATGHGGDGGGSASVQTSSSSPSTHPHVMAALVTSENAKEDLGLNVGEHTFGGE